MPNKSLVEIIWESFQQHGDNVAIVSFEEIGHFLRRYSSIRRRYSVSVLQYIYYIFSAAFEAGPFTCKKIWTPNCMSI